jgi:hypothetical protein
MAASRNRLLYRKYEAVETLDNIPDSNNLITKSTSFLA